MSTTLASRRRAALYGLIVAVASVLLLTTALAKIADAHGNIVSPASRNYGCWQRWGSDFQNPAMATQDPMCWQAWQANPNAMWNWNGLFREGVAGNHQGAIPDGQLCSAGRTEGGRYNAMDTVGDWKAQSIGTNFSVKLYDQASHGADYIRVYVTKQGYNPITQPLGWGNLELVGQIGNTPASQWTPESAGGVSIQVGGSASGRSGRHIVYTIWQASHLDQSYYFCSDVTFGGVTPSQSASPSASPSRPPSASPSPSRPPSASPSASPSAPSSPPPPGGCSATYSLTGQWPGGFQGEVKVTAGSSAITKWTVTVAWTNGQQITNAWNATVTTSGSTATAKSVAHNSALSAGASTTFGFLGSYTGSANGAPTLTCSPT
ncbi:lytic polysaccharide monooxygenase auxiliary activity family 9 protein [Catellatospora sichuanensis]|uniref:lytic polysaccharide monooxygenase auxiliary activity family 9 protein n=1 Tax=Catellatospora sichuanensis TaxID=1969805 RepID=UPI001182E4C7|nr:lytic polysaccharide monooxygenase [Catellatospora sichuanensis]